MGIDEQILVDKNGQPDAVQISISRYKKMMDIIEEIEEIKVYEKAKKLKRMDKP